MGKHFPVLLRFLKTSWTVFFAVTCLLVIGLWVRSYQWCDCLYSNLNPPKPAVISLQGRLQFSGDVRAIRRSSSATHGFVLFAGQVAIFSKAIESHVDGTYNFYLPGSVTAYGRWSLIPHWFVAMIAACIAIVPWIRWSLRYSLRTLLIAMTVICAALAGLVWLIE